MKLTTFLAILPLLFAGCVMKRSAKLSDGQEVQFISYWHLASPPMTVVAQRASGSTNWVIGQSVSANPVLQQVTGGAGYLLGQLYRATDKITVNANSSGSTVNSVNNATIKIDDNDKNHHHSK